MDNCSPRPSSRKPLVSGAEHFRKLQPGKECSSRAQVQWIPTNVEPMEFYKATPIPQAQGLMQKKNEKIFKVRG